MGLRGTRDIPLWDGHHVASRGTSVIWRGTALPAFHERPRSLRQVAGPHSPGRELSRRTRTPHCLPQRGPGLRLPVSTLTSLLSRELSAPPPPENLPRVSGTHASCTSLPAPKHSRLHALLSAKPDGCPEAAVTAWSRVGRSHTCTDSPVRKWFGTVCPSHDSRRKTVLVLGSHSPGLMGWHQTGGTR